MMDSIGKIVARLAGSIAARRRRTVFTCGDCERTDRCGLPPSEGCLFRIEQMSREDHDLTRRVKALSPW